MNYSELYNEINGKTVVVVNEDSVGTGFMVDRRGLIATAEHVVTGNDNVGIITADTNPNTVLARVIKRDQKLDIALLKIPNELIPAELGDSSSVTVGDEIIILGFPFGNNLWGMFTPAIHQGIISNIIHLTDQQTKKTTKRFQLDVMANKGNSGGPLALNKNGKVIGILTSVFLEKPFGDIFRVADKPLTSPTGIAISVPIEYVKEMIQNLNK